MDRPKLGGPRYVMDLEKLKQRMEADPPTCRFCRDVLPVDDLVFWCDHLLGHTEVQGQDRADIIEAKEQLILIMQLPEDKRHELMLHWAKHQLDQNPKAMRAMIEAGILTKVRKDG